MKTAEEKIKQRIEQIAIDKSASPSDWRWIEGYMIEGYKIAMEELVSNLWTSPCDCPTDQKTGETWCCNHCGKPTARTGDELPGDDVVNKQAKVSCKGNSHAMRYHHMLEQFREGAKWMRSLASPAIASRDARIRELGDIIHENLGTGYLK
jgi:hypothetical protein